MIFNHDASVGCNIKGSGVSAPDQPNRYEGAKVTPQESILSSCICGKDNCEIPFGFCHCGCGRQTIIAERSNTKSGTIKGVPQKYIFGHHRKVYTVAEYAVPFKIDGVYCRLIPLTQGIYAIVWESDYYWLMQWKWHAFLCPKTQRFYAGRTDRTKTKQARHMNMHRQILGLDFGDPREGDHIDCDRTLDNRRSNLRLSGRSGQCCNQGKRVDNTSGYKGVTFHKATGKFAAQIGVDGKRIHLGLRSTAAEAYWELYVPAALKYHREFARLI